MAVSKDVMRNKEMKILAKYILIKCLMNLNDITPSLTITCHS